MSTSDILNPLLSVVATSRNDDHGGNALWRTQHFVNGLAEQALKFEFPIELILVDWNPPFSKEGLFEVLDWSKQNSYFTYRVIQVPNEYHMKFNHAEQLPLFQYIAKNVGIRRATADFILSTNIDILFSNELMAYFKKGLQTGYLYRVDRYDTDLKESVSPFEPFQKILEQAQNNCIRVNGRKMTVPFKMGSLGRAWLFIKHIFYVCGGYFLRQFRRIKSLFKNVPRSLSQFPKVLIEVFRGLYKTEKNFFRYIHNLLFRLSSKAIHMNACGDFTLLSKKDWEKLRGYPEWELYSWHIDSVLLYQAHYNSISMWNLPTSQMIYHIEHGRGSGWTPEGAKLLFDRLDKQGISYMSDEDLAEEFEKQKQLRKQNKPVIYNDENWGAAHIQFSEKGSLERA